MDAAVIEVYDHAYLSNAKEVSLASEMRKGHFQHEHLGHVTGQNIEMQHSPLSQPLHGTGHLWFIDLWVIVPYCACSARCAPKLTGHPTNSEVVTVTRVELQL